MSSNRREKEPWEILMLSFFIKYIWAGCPPEAEGVMELKKNPQKAYLKAANTDTL